MKVCFATRTILFAARPDPPSNVRVTSSEKTSQVVTYDEPNDHGSVITSYNVQRRNEYEDEWVIMATDDVINTTSYTSDGLLPFNAYSYRVTATNKIGESDLSEQSTFMKTLVGGEFLWGVKPGASFVLQHVLFRQSGRVWTHCSMQRDPKKRETKLCILFTPQRANEASPKK